MIQQYTITSYKIMLTNHLLLDHFWFLIISHFQHSQSCAYFHPRQLTSLAHSLLSLTLGMGTWYMKMVDMLTYVSDKCTLMVQSTRGMALLFCADIVKFAIQS